MCLVQLGHIHGFVVGGGAAPVLTGPSRGGPRSVPLRPTGQGAAAAAQAPVSMEAVEGQPGMYKATFQIPPNRCDTLLPSCSPMCNFRVYRDVHALALPLTIIVEGAQGLTCLCLCRGRVADFVNKPVMTRGAAFSFQQGPTPVSPTFLSQ